MHEAWPKAHHRASPDLAIRQRQLCSGARPSAQPKSLARRDRNRFRSLQGRVTTATPVPGNWTSCFAWMTGRHEGCVSTMLTESGLSIALQVCHFKGRPRRNGSCKPTSPPYRGAFRLDKLELPSHQTNSLSVDLHQQRTHVVLRPYTGGYLRPKIKAAIQGSRDTGGSRPTPVCRLHHLNRREADVQGWLPATQFAAVYQCSR